MLTRLNWLFWETLIIVVGVLLAISVNDYWTERQERTLELDYLQRLRADIQSDYDYANEYLNRRWTRKLAALNAIAPVVRGQAPIPQEIEAFLIEVTMAASGGVSPSNWVASTTYEDLAVTGNLRLIKKGEIRRMLSDYYRGAEDFVNRQRARVTGYPRFLHSILPGELRDDLDIEAMQIFGVERALERVQSAEFEDLMNQEYNFAWFKVRAYQIQRDAAAKLVEELDAYIQSLGQ
jgi:hypothetical protein